LFAADRGESLAWNARDQIRRREFVQRGVTVGVQENRRARVVELTDHTKWCSGGSMLVGGKPEFK
jgi:hypothetical protein